MSPTEARATPDPSPKRKPRRWRKPLLIGLVMAALVLGTPVGLYLYHQEAADAPLREAIAEADRLDPGWRLEELEARRAETPDKENSALHVMRVKRLLPPNWASSPPFTDLFLEENPPEAQLSPAQVKALQQELDKAAAALPQARKLKDMPRGRFPITYARDGISTLLASHEARDVAYLLHNASLLRAQEGDADGALECCRAICNCARAIGDEPSLVSQLVRIACRSTAVSDAERVLAQGQPSAPALLALQRALEEEELEPLLLIAMRGERALLDRLMAALQHGEFPLNKAFGGPGAGKREIAPVQFEEVMRNSPLALKRERAALLRYLNEVVEACKRPSAERAKRLGELAAESKNLPRIASLLVPAFHRVADAERRSRAELRGAIAALAAERYRVERGAWPAKGAELVATGYLKAWLDDPFDGKPLRWKRLADGVVIYSIGEDGKDDGGNVHHDPVRGPRTDVGVRLWDVGRRRQPPPPPRPPIGGVPGGEPEPPPDGKEP
jgi:hypothetical protein